MNEPDKAPAFILARAGFDVWMGNNRGSYYSEEHVKWSIKDKEYWEFDFEEMGLHDLPAFIDFILITSGARNLTYIGHSQGTTQFFVGASLMSEYFQNKVNLFVALAPIVRMDHIKNEFLIKTAFIPTKLLQTVFEGLHFYNVMPRTKISGVEG